MSDSLIPDGYTFTSPSFESSFRKFKDYFEDGVLTDVSLIVNEHSIKCHKVILASYCPYFQNMFTKEFKESEANIVKMTDIDYETLKEIINFLYTRSITITTNNVVELLLCSHSFGIEELITACSNFIIRSLNAENSFGISSIAHRLNLKHLYSVAIKCIEKDFYKVYNTNEYKDVDIDVLKTLLASDDLNVRKEKEVFEAVVTWVLHQEERENLLFEIIRFVRFPLIAKQELKDILCHPIINKNSDSKHLIQASIALQENHALRLEVPTEKVQPRKSYSGIIFYIGGQGSNGIPASLTRIYSLHTKKWEILNEPLETRGQSGCLWYKGSIVRIGGYIQHECLDDVEVYNPVGVKHDTWNRKKMKNMSFPRRRLGVCCIDDVFYACGGIFNEIYLNTVEAFAVSERKWENKPPMEHCRGDVSVVELKGHLLAIGGNDGSRSLSSCEIYFPSQNLWKSISSLNIPRHGAAAVTMDEFVYVFGGFNNGIPLDSVELYNLEMDQWTILTKMKNLRGEAGIATLGRQVFLIGGKNAERHLGTMEIFNVDDNSWEEGPTIKNCKVGADVITGYLKPVELEKLKEYIIEGNLIEDF